VELEEERVEVGGRELRLLVPPDAEALLDEEAFEREEYLPYWAELWPSGVRLARALAGRDLRDARVLELGCGLGVPSITAALAGAAVLATDWSPHAIDLLRTNAERNGTRLEAAVSSWLDPRRELDGAPWDLVLAADVLYLRQNVEALLRLLPRLIRHGGEALVSDPSRAGGRDFAAAARRLFALESSPAPAHTNVVLHRIRSC
jgi:predicted nicotinamide N-methyase